MRKENVKYDKYIQKTVVMREIFQSWALRTGHPKQGTENVNFIKQMLCLGFETVLI